MGNGQSELEPDTMADLVENTKFTKEEIKQWFKGYQKDCPDGRLSKEQFKKVYSDLFPNGDASKFADNVFRVFDVNQDGVVDFREFLIGLSKPMKGSVDEKLKWAFSVYDLDENGVISKDEIQEIMSSIYKMVDGKGESAEAKTNEIFKKLDLNEDGKITFQEFTEGAKTDASIVKMLGGNVD